MSPLVVDGPAPGARPGRASRSARVLLVEDDPGVRAFTARILEDSRYRVSVAGTPMEAMALFLAHGQQFDLVITDVVLPGGGGLQLLDELLALRPELRIIVCSGYLDDRSQHDVLTAGGSRISPSPIPSTICWARLRRHWANASLATSCLGIDRQHSQRNGQQKEEAPERLPLDVQGCGGIQMYVGSIRPSGVVRVSRIQDEVKGDPGALILVAADSSKLKRIIQQWVEFTGRVPSPTAWFVLSA